MTILQYAMLSLKLELLETLLLFTSLLVTFLFFVYGYNCYYLLRAARGYEPPRLTRINHRRKPSVAIHLPVYNEKYVVGRLIKACVKMAEQYGKKRVRIVVLDDSDDETSQLIDRLVDKYSERGFAIEVLRRGSRAGFKAGALQKALEEAREKYIVVFDADFVPPPDFLNKTIPIMESDKRIGVVQCRWEHINRDYNFLTKCISIGVDAHFLVEHPGRQATNCLINFNGSAGVIRRKALVDAGGWQVDTLAEDLDASYRIQLKGYRVLYLSSLACPGEVPPTIPSFKRQQNRWACGSMQVARKILPTLLRDNRLGLRQKIEAFIHLTYYAVHPLMLLSFLLAALASILNLNVIAVRIPEEIREVREISELVGASQQIISQNPLLAALAVVMGLAILCCMLSVWVMYGVAMKRQGLNPFKNIHRLLLLSLIGYGISISNTIEVAKALLTRRVWGFERTPKYAIEAPGDEWRSKKYQVPLNFKNVLEFSAAALGSLSIYSAISHSNLGIIPIVVFYTMSYMLVGALTLKQSRNE